MKNMIVLQKDEDGKIYCKQISEEGKAFHLDDDSVDGGMWDEGGVILLEELEEILDKEV